MAAADTQDLRHLLSLALHGARIVTSQPTELHGAGTFRQSTPGLAIRHGIAVEVQAGAELCGEFALADALSAASRQLVMRGMRMRVVLESLHRSLEPAGVPFLIFKGAPTAVVTRHEPYGRPSSDIDLLVLPEDLPTTHRFLVAGGAQLLPRFPTPRSGFGYRCYQRFRQEVTYEFQGTHIDLHWQVGYARHSLPNCHDALARSVTVDFDGLSLSTLAPSDALTHAALHWRYGSYDQIKYVLDLVGLQRWAEEHMPVRPRLSPSVASTLALANGLVANPSCIATGIRPLGVTRPDWRLARRSWLSKRGDLSPEQVRRRAIWRHLRTTPGILDKAEVPIRTASGPVLRAYDRIWKRADRLTREGEL